MARDGHGDFHTTCPACTEPLTAGRAHSLQCALADHLKLNDWCVCNWRPDDEQILRMGLGGACSRCSRLYAGTEHMHFRRYCVFGPGLTSQEYAAERLASYGVQAGVSGPDDTSRAADRMRNDDGKVVMTRKNYGYARSAASPWTRARRPGASNHWHRCQTSTSSTRPRIALPPPLP